MWLAERVSNLGVGGNAQRLVNRGGKIRGGDRIAAGISSLTVNKAWIVRVSVPASSKCVA